MNATKTAERSRREVIFDYTPFSNTSRGLRGWWLSPPRRGIYRLISPWEYRHLRFFGGVHIAGAYIQAAAGFICLAYGVPGWAAFFLAIAALNFAGGAWFVTIAHHTDART